MSDVLTVVAKIYPKAGNEAEVQALLVRMAEAVRAAEPDCPIYRPHRRADRRSCSAFEFHKTAPHLAAVRTQMKGLLEKPTCGAGFYAITVTADDGTVVASCRAVSLRRGSAGPRPGRRQEPPEHLSAER